MYAIVGLISRAICCNAGGDIFAIRDRSVNHPQETGDPWLREIGITRNP